MPLSLRFPRPRPAFVVKVGAGARVSGGVSRRQRVSGGVGQYPLIDTADALRNRVASAFVRTIEAVKAQIPLKVLAERLDERDFNGIMQVIDLKPRMEAAAKGSGLGVKETSLLESLKDVWAAGAKAEMEALGKIPVEKANIGVQMSFDLMSEEAINFLSTYTMDLIREVTDETRFAIGDVVLDAFEHGGHPFAQAREIKDIIGLTRQQVKAVKNFRNMLENQAFSDALTRELRDKRFDSTLLQAAKAGAKLKQDQIDKMVQRYYEKYLKYRAEMIARTETIRAAHMGQAEAWRQAMAQGLLKPGRYVVWIITPDDRLCEACKSVRRMNPDGVPMGEMFQSEIGPIARPPLHPHCRCTVELKAEWTYKKKGA